MKYQYYAFGLVLLAISSFLTSSAIADTEETFSINLEIRATKLSSNDWDGGFSIFTKPDPMIFFGAEPATGGACSNTTECTVKHWGDISNPITVVDKDTEKHDPIGVVQDASRCFDQPCDILDIEDNVMGKLMIRTVSRFNVYDTTREYLEQAGIALETLNAKSPVQKLKVGSKIILEIGKNRDNPVLSCFAQGADLAGFKNADKLVELAPSFSGLGTSILAYNPNEALNYCLINVPGYKAECENIFKKIGCKSSEECRTLIPKYMEIAELAKQFGTNELKSALAGKCSSFE